MGEDNHLESSDDELLAVASAEEYAAKIIKLQQACLIPLKEDLAEWLNKILKTSNITTENFMDRLDNGVIICRLAKIISLWCEQQLTSTTTSTTNSPVNLQWMRDYHGQVRDAKYVPDGRANNVVSFISSSSTNIHLPRNDKLPDPKSHEPPLSTAASAQICTNLHTNANGPLRSTASQSSNCLMSSASATSLNNGPSTYTHHHQSSNQFLINLIKMHQTKIWEDAKCRTFYARDNVCNFIKWSRDFGVNRSVLFESDDLVLHANPRQVVLCLLDVARIAYVKYGFTEAPGLVKFEQEIDKELQAAENSVLFQIDADSSVDARPKSAQATIDEHTEGYFHRNLVQHKALRKTKQSTGRNMINPLPIDATDKLVMRYCRHKEEAARKKNEERLAAEAANGNDMAIANEESLMIPNDQSKSTDQQKLTNSTTSVSLRDKSSVIENQTQRQAKNRDEMDATMTTCDGSDPILDMCDDYAAIVSSTTTCDLNKAHNKKDLADNGRGDSLDDGEGPTESASTGYSSQSSRKRCNQNTATPNHTSIPVPMKRTNNYTSSQTSYLTESSIKSELSSSRSSLLSVQDGNNSNSNYERQATSDLDGKVMRIAKSYYGKKATKDVTRLSEGKYKIADRIVFVRLLKGHRVMVRIGGGWDTLENFLFRHKSDPSQVIDPDNLLPLETKMPFDKTGQTPTPTKSTSKLPYYRLSNSASSNSLSLSNLSISNHSLISGSNRIAQNRNRGVGMSGDLISKSEQSSPMIENRLRQPQFPLLLNTHKGQTNVTENLQAHSSPSQQKNRILQSISIHNTPTGPQMKRPFYYQKTTAPSTASKYSNHQRPLASSLAQAVSATNIHLYDSSSSSPVRSQAARRDRGPNRKLLLK